MLDKRTSWAHIVRRSRTTGRGHEDPQLLVESSISRVPSGLYLPNSLDVASPGRGAIVVIPGKPRSEWSGGHERARYLPSKYWPADSGDNRRIASDCGRR